MDFAVFILTAILVTLVTAEWIRRQPRRYRVELEVTLNGEMLYLGNCCSKGHDSYEQAMNHGVAIGKEIADNYEKRLGGEHDAAGA